MLSATDRLRAKKPTTLAPAPATHKTTTMQNTADRLQKAGDLLAQDAKVVAQSRLTARRGEFSDKQLAGIATNLRDVHTTVFRSTQAMMTLDTAVIQASMNTVDTERKERAANADCRHKEAHAYATSLEKLIKDLKGPVNHDIIDQLIKVIAQTHQTTAGKVKNALKLIGRLVRADVRCLASLHSEYVQTLPLKNVPCSFA
jgi:hypothetical protein